MKSRWLRWVGPGVIALGAVGSLATATLGAGQRPLTPQPWTTRLCSGGAAERTAAANFTRPTTLPDLGLQAWFRMDAMIDDAGTLQGQRVSLGLDGVRGSPDDRVACRVVRLGPLRSDRVDRQR